MSDNTQDNTKIIDRIIKLLKLAGNNPNAEEAASAAAKAQEMMTAYNLDVASLEKAGGKEEGKREKSAIEGGFYKYQRDLYAAVSELNFCTHWIGEELVPVSSGVAWRKAGKPADFKAWRKVHRLIGRTVNIASTKVMCDYLLGAIERLLRDYMDEHGMDHTYLYSKRCMSFREGAVANLIERIQDERERAEKERQKKAKEDAVRNSHPSSAPSTSRALALTDYAASEEAANYDVRYGAGAWARRLALRAEMDADAKAYWKREAENDEAMECLAIFHPEEYRKIKEQEAKEREKMETRWRKDAEREARRKWRADAKRDWSGFREGRERAENISLNQQIDHHQHRRLK